MSASYLTILVAETSFWSVSHYSKLPTIVSISFGPDWFNMGFYCIYIHKYIFLRGGGEGGGKAKNI